MWYREGYGYNITNTYEIVLFEMHSTYKKITMNAAVREKIMLLFEMAKRYKIWDEIFVEMLLLYTCLAIQHCHLTKRVGIQWEFILSKC